MFLMKGKLIEEKARTNALTGGFEEVVSDDIRHRGPC